MSFLSRSAWPAPGSPEFAPALACAILVLLAALQLALPSRTELPQDAGLALRRHREPVAAPIPAYPALAKSDPFSPDRAGDVADGGSIEACAVSGVLTLGRQTAVLVKASGAPARLVRLGEIACGWRLSHVERNTVEFADRGQRRILTVGQPPRSPSQTIAQPPQGAESAQ